LKFFLKVAPVVNSQLPTSGNSKNQSHWSFEHDQTPHLEKLHFGKRFSFPSAVQSNDELVVEQKSAVIAEEVKPKPVELAVVDSNEVPVHTSSRTGRSNLQSFSIWDTTPVEAAAVRPSSR
jgi:cell division protein FtsN